MSEVATPFHARQATLDGTLTLRALLRHGFAVSVYPRQVVTATPGASAPGAERIEPGHGATELSFVHGLPGTSGLAPVTFSQDKRMRRALLERAGIAVPKGATFTMGRGVRGSHRFAHRIGFPVVVKPAVGDNAIETFAGIGDDAALEAALDHLRTPPTERPGFSRAAYGLTELREPGEENGRIVVPSSYTFLVEKQLSGAYLRCLVIGDEVHSVISCVGAPGDGSLTGGIEILHQIHPGFTDLARRAAAVIDGLAVVTVDIVAPNPYDHPSTQTFGVVELSERPGLWVQAMVDPQLAEGLAEEILISYARSCGVAVAGGRDEVTVELEAHALPDVVEGAAAIESAASEAGLRCRITDSDRVAGVVRADLSGGVGPMAELTDALLDGRIDRQQVMLAVLSPRPVMR